MSPTDPMDVPLETSCATCGCAYAVTPRQLLAGEPGPCGHRDELLARVRAALGGDGSPPDERQLDELGARLGEHFPGGPEALRRLVESIGQEI